MNRELLSIYLDNLRSLCRSIRADVNDIENIEGYIRDIIEEDKKDED